MFSFCALNHCNCFISCCSVIRPIISIIGGLAVFRPLSLRCSCFKTELVIQGAWTACFTRFSRQGQFSSSMLLKSDSQESRYHQSHQYEYCIPMGLTQCFFESVLVELLHVTRSNILIFLHATRCALVVIFAYSKIRYMIREATVKSIQYSLRMI